MSCSISALPDEVLLRILGEADQADRLAFLTVSRAFRPVAERALFADVIFTSISQAPIFYQRWQNMRRSRRTSAPPVKSLSFYGPEGERLAMSTDKNEWMRDFKYARSFMLPILLATCDQLTYLCLSILPVEGGQSILDGVASLTSLLHLVMHNDIFNQLETFVITMDTALACVASLPKLQELALYNITGDVSTSSALQYTGQVQRLSLHGVDDLTDTGLRAMLLGLAPAATGLQISSCADLTPGLLHVVSVVGRTLLDLLLLCCDNGTLSVTDRAIQDSGFASMRVLRCAIIKGNCITGEGLSKAPASLLDLRVEASDNVTAAWLCLCARLRIARADWLWIDIKAILVRDIASKQLPCSLICSAS